jgi:hypothetical protein
VYRCRGATAKTIFFLTESRFRRVGTLLSGQAPIAPKECARRPRVVLTYAGLSGCGNTLTMIRVVQALYIWRSFRYT